MFIRVIGGAGIENDTYERLQQFIQLEKNGRLEYAKQHAEAYDGMFQIDLSEFGNSKEFKQYYERSIEITNQSEAVAIGWGLFLLTEIIFLLVILLRKIFRSRRN